MSSIHKLEVRIADWYKGAPHLPKGGQKWLADNVWWIAVIGAVFGALALLAVIPLTLLALGLSAGAGAHLEASMYGGYSSPVMMWLSAVVSFISLAAITVLTAMAISPLKDHRKKGWDLIFLSMLVNVISLVLSIVMADFSGLIGGIVGIIIGGYFLFEIRSFFLDGKAKPVAAEKKPATKTETK